MPVQRTRTGRRSLSELEDRCEEVELQLEDLQATIQRVPCETVVFATPIDLGRVVQINKPTARVTYAFEERDDNRLAGLLQETFGSTVASE